MSLRIEGQIFIFHFDADDDLLPKFYSDEVLRELPVRSKNGPIGLIATFGPNVRTVHTQTVSFWLERARDKNVNLRAISVVTTRLALRIAVKAFSQATGLFKPELQAQHFPDEPTARSWLEAQLKGATVALKG